ncbi:MAG: transposase [Planctomycetota bacterium]
MSPAYVNTSKQVIPFAEEIIVHDPFHVMKLANEDLDKVCKQEHRRLLDQVGNTLSRSKYLWLTGMENHTESQTARFESICTLKLETGRVWSYKELFRGLWKQPDSRTARSFFQERNRSVIPT